MAPRLDHYSTQIARAGDYSTSGEWMRSSSALIPITILAGIALLVMPSRISSQQAAPGQAVSPAAELPDTPQPASAPAGAKSAGQPIPLSKQQPKRILGLMPNFRAVSAGAIPPPPTPKQALKIATENSVDYSSFVFVGLTSMIAEGENAHPKLGKGVPGMWAYSWRGYVDKADGNYWVIFVLPTLFHEDERYYARGQGSILTRGLYASSRVLITPNYNGHNTINLSELLGRGAAQGISTTYYPSSPWCKQLNSRRSGIEA